MLRNRIGHLGMRLCQPFLHHNVLKQFQDTHTHGFFLVKISFSFCPGQSNVGVIMVKRSSSL